MQKSRDRYKTNHKFYNQQLSERLKVLEVKLSTEDDKTVLLTPLVTPALKKTNPVATTPTPKEPTPAPAPSPMSTVSTDTGYSTTSSQYSQSSTPQMKVPVSGTQAVNLNRIPFGNPHKNWCFITSVVHFLKAPIPPEDYEALESLHHLKEEDKKQHSPALQKFSQLLHAIHLYETGTDTNPASIQKALEAFIQTCTAESGFNTALQFSGAKTRLESNAQSSADPRPLYRLKQVDANEFLLPLQAAIHQLTPPVAQFQLFQRMQTVWEGKIFTKLAKSRDPSTILEIPLKPTGSIQKGISDFVQDSDKKMPEKIEWDQDTDSITSSDPVVTLPTNSYQTIKSYQIEAPNSRLRSFNICLGINEYDRKIKVAKKKTAVCNLSTQHAFNPVTMSLIDSETHELFTLKASPVAIIAHSGEGLDAGHYVTLEKTLNGWLLLNDDEPPALLDDPTETLRKYSLHP